MSFYYLREKEEVLFDFSLKAPIMLKYQIFKMLNYILDMKINRHDRREISFAVKAVLRIL